MTAKCDFSECRLRNPLEDGKAQVHADAILPCVSITVPWYKSFKTPFSQCDMCSDAAVSILEPLDGSVLMCGSGFGGCHPGQHVWARKCAQRCAIPHLCHTPDKINSQSACPTVQHTPSTLKCMYTPCIYNTQYHKNIHTTHAAHITTQHILSTLRYMYIPCM